MKRSKISDVAAAAGVSKSTVSNYLNGRYDNMSAETRERIQQAVRALNYTPNISARRLSAKQRCHVICVIIPMNIASAFENRYYPIVLSAVGKLSAELGYSILIYARRNASEELHYLKGMAGTIADGFMMFDLQNDDYYFLEFEKAGIPYICVGKFDCFNEYRYVASDHGKSIHDSVEYLVHLGHKKIGLLLEGGSSVVSRVRRTSFERAMATYGLPVQEHYIASIEPYFPSDFRQNYTVCKTLLEQPEAPTALVAPSTALAGIEQALAETGRTIPDDLSVVAVDYMEGYNLQYTNYTRVESAAHLVAETALRKLVDSIENRKEEFVSQVIPLQFHVGTTTGKPKR